MFIMHIAFILEVFAIAAGLITLHYAKKSKAQLIKAAGLILTIFGILGFICAGYYALKYYFNGEFDSACGSKIMMENLVPNSHRKVDMEN